AGRVKRRRIRFLCTDFIQEPSPNLPKFNQEPSPYLSTVDAAQANIKWLGICRQSHVPVFERRASHLSTVDPTTDAQLSEPQHTRRASDRNDSPVTISHQPSPQREVSPPKPASGAASPLPTLAPAAQIESASPQAEEAAFQIHEDPFMEGIEASEAQKTQQSQDARSVLSEVPVNEFSQVATAESSNREEMPRTEDSPPQSPQTKSETLRSRKLLMSGIERIRGRTLDAHGFRKVLELIKSSESGEIFGSV
ncbi:hypothetical protein KCU86_g23958, partial [Aureobasidium melanogenum]